MVSQRVFVGNLFQNYDVCLEELLSRFGKFGKCSDGGFEKHNTFAYINMDFDQDADFTKLKQSLNNVKFKGNMLKIDVAKPTWDVRWKAQHEADLKQEPFIEKFNQEQEWKHYKKLENIKMSWKDRKEIIPGRNRIEKRTRYQLRNSTFRVNVDGSLKVYKLYQNKLWGYERDKTAKDLAYQYVNGKWWNNYNHIIDRLDYSRSRLSIHGKRVEHVVNPATSKHNEQISEDKENADEDIDLEEQMIQEEKSKNTNILDQFLGEMNLDEPLNVVDSDEAEAFGFSDNENTNEGGYYNNNNYDQYNNNDDYYNNKDSQYENKYNNNSNYNEDYNKNYNETYNDKNNNNNSKSYENQQEESEEEFIPTFGAKPSTDEQAADPVQGTVSNTETLRALFNPATANESTKLSNRDEGGSFKLIQEDNDDIDQTKNIQEEAENVEEHTFPTATTLLAKTQHQNRLFFPHFDSPFLVGQTQLSQIETASNNDIWANWEEQFWENRGVWMKEMKNKKRDVLRQKKKRQSKDNNIIMI